MQVAGEADRSPKLKADTQASQVDHGPHGETRPRKLNAPFTKHKVFQQVALSPKLGSLASACLGGREVVLLTDQLFMKPPSCIQLLPTVEPIHSSKLHSCKQEVASLISPTQGLEVVVLVFDQNPL